ncbi:MAG: serine/threonine protein kinase [Deltaproteobacteria bacterium]|nr:serine/threonine protein kinase [Deltaproteobacteria bacterium]
MERRPFGATPSETIDSGAARRRLGLGAKEDERGIRYTIIRNLDRGGMGELFLATMERPGLPPVEVAVKRLLAELLDDEKYVDMFRSEAEVMARLDHPNIVKVYDTPVIDGSQCLAMEYVNGRSVQQILMRCEETRSLMPPAVVLRIMADILHGLEYAHNYRLPDGTPLNLVHRDVSPGNLLVGFDGRAKLTDFGIAKSRMSAVSTTVGIVKGKARYLSPEQILGDPASPRSDLFSAAAVTAEMLTGLPTFDKPSVPKTLYAIVNGERPDLEHQLDFRAPLLVQTLNRALATDPKVRLQTAGELAEGLEAAGRLLGGFDAAVVSDFLTQLFEGPDSGVLELASDDIHREVTPGYTPHPDLIPAPAAPIPVASDAPPTPVATPPPQRRHQPTDLINRAERRPPPAAPPTPSTPPTELVPDTAVLAPQAPNEGSGPTNVLRANTLPPKFKVTEASVDEALSVLAWLQARQSDQTKPNERPSALSNLVEPPPGPTADLGKPKSQNKRTLIWGAGLLAGIVLTLIGQAVFFGDQPNPKASAPDPAANTKDPTLVATASVTEEEEEPDLPPEPELPPAVAPYKGMAILDIMHPKGAKVRIDGRLIRGRVPIRGLEVGAGKRRIRIVKGRYVRDLVLDLEDGEQMVLNRPRR